MKKSIQKNQIEVVKELTEQLEESIHHFMESEKYKDFLSKMSLFHSYSLNNQLLIAMQCPDATLCASYTGWKRQNRYVKAGEKGIRIICPIPHKVFALQDAIDPDTGKPGINADGSTKKDLVEKVITYYKVGYTFDISQTKGQPLPKITKELQGDLDNSMKDILNVLCEISPVSIRFDVISGSAHGYYHLDNKEIVISNSLSEKQTIKTIIHEISHAILHAKDNPNVPKDSQTKEIQALYSAFQNVNHFKEC